MSHESSEPTRQRDRGLGCLARLFWMVLGYLLLLFAAIEVVKRSGGWSLSVADLVYWAILAGMLAARYGDIRYFGGRTSDGQQPATWADWRRYSAILAILGLLLWIILHAVAAYR